MNKPFLGYITGNPNVTTIVRVNVREQPGTSAGIGVRFQVNVGLTNLPVLEVQPDRDLNALNGKVFQWFRMQFHNGQQGWVRDDLVSLSGDGTAFGYPYLPNITYAFSLVRQLLPDDDSMLPNPPVLPPGDGTTPPPPPPPADVFGIVISNNGLRLREAPLTGQIKTVLPYKTQVKIVQVQPQGGTSNYKWAKVESPSGVGWLRTDYLSISGDASRFGLSKGDEYPVPLSQYWWIRGYNQGQNANESIHPGWDFGAPAGTPIIGGPNGGFVIRLLTCSRCTATHPNTLSQGIPFDSPSVFLDPAWGYGYGNAILVRYLNTQLPASTRERLVSAGFSGMHLYVMYAHLSSISVQNRASFLPRAQIGVIGNTGNSTATHLHIEVRAWANDDDTNWAAMRPNALDPEVLYLR